MPGGQEGILLSRVALLNDFEPEFVSATVLPGVGMQLLQLGVATPGAGTHELLAGPSLSDAAHMDVQQIAAAPFHLRVSTRHLQDSSTGDDILGAAHATSVDNQTLVDGGEATGSFDGGSTGVSATVGVTLAGRVIDVVVRATNTSDAYRFVGLEWCPDFMAPQGGLSQWALAVPAKTSISGQPSTTFTAADGGRLQGGNMNVTFTSIPRDFLGDGTVVRLLNAPGKYQLRITGMGQTLRSMQLTTDADGHAARVVLSSLDPTAESALRDQMIRPGQIMQWHLRVEIQPIKTAAIGTEEGGPSTPAQ